MEKASIEMILAELLRMNSKIDGLQEQAKIYADKIDQQFNGLRTEFNGLRTEFNGLRTEFNGLRTEFNELRTEFSELRIEFRIHANENKYEFQRVHKIMDGISEQTARNHEDITALRNPPKSTPSAF